MRTFWIGIILLSNLTPSYGDSLCERVLRSSANVWSSIKSTANDIRDYPIARPYRGDGPTPEWYGVTAISEGQGYFRKITRSFPLILFGYQAVNRYELSPFRSAYEYLARRPFGWMTQRILGMKLEPACIPRLLIAAASSICLATGSLETASKYAVWSATPHLEQLVKNDIRYRGLTTPEQAFGRESQLVFYYQHLTLSGEISPYFDPENRFSFIYQDLESVITIGVPAQVVGFQIPPESIGPLSADKKIKLIQLEDALYLGYQALAEMFNDARPIEEIKKSQTTLNQIQKSLYADAVVKQLLANRSPENLKKAQEYLFWLITFRKYDVIGIKKLKPLPDGSFSTQTMTVEDVLGVR